MVFQIVLSSACNAIRTLYRVRGVRSPGGDVLGPRRVPARLALVPAPVLRAGQRPIQEPRRAHFGAGAKRARLQRMVALTEVSACMVKFRICIVRPLYASTSREGRSPTDL